MADVTCQIHAKNMLFHFLGAVFVLENLYFIGNLVLILVTFL